MSCPAGHCPRISLANSFSTKLHKCLRYHSTQSSCSVWRSVCHKAAQPCVHVIQHYSWPLHLVPLCASAGQAYLSCVCACCLSFMQKQLRLAILLHACFITLLSRIIAILSHSMHLELLMPCIMHSSIAWRPKRVMAAFIKHCRRTPPACNRRVRQSQPQVPACFVA